MAKTPRFARQVRWLPAAVLALSALACTAAAARPAAPAPAHTLAPPAAAALPLPTALPPTTMPPSPSPTVTPPPTAAPTRTPGPTATPAPIVTSWRAAETRGPISLDVTTVVRKYAVGGATGVEIDGEMRTFGPRDEAGGYVWYALTTPRFDWAETCDCAEAGCTTGPVTMFLSVDYALPIWYPPDGEGDPALVEAWLGFAAALRAHEEGHGALAEQCAWALGEAFAALPPQPDCGAVKEAVRSASDGVFAECRAAQRAYENATNHGLSEGVVWPPPLP